MNICERLTACKRLFRAALALLELPRARLHFYSHNAPSKIRAIFLQFNKPHARIPMIKNKTLGIALIDLSNFNGPEEYIATVKKRDFAGYHAKVAKKRGYTVRRIDRNRHIHEIHAINTSADSRQGRPMDLHYQTLHTSYDDSAPMQCYGVFNAQGHLSAYCRFGVYGDFAATDCLLGYKNNDGIMYLLLSEIVCAMITDGKLKYFMYDTFLGAQPGLQSFKRRIGFQPYRVSYAID